MNQRFIRDKTGRIVLWQSPNPLLIGWAVFALLSRFTGWPPLAGIGTGLLFIWAIMELYLGVNIFRRLVGLFVLILILSPQFSQ